VNLDVGLFGEVRGEWPVVTDTGHVATPLRDRDGASRTTWYRGPLAPFPVTRDPLGPYHTADQCRRVSPETGMEDLTYAAAFEVGRLLAASDARFAQELMRWRRVDYRRSVERRVELAVAERLELAPSPVALLARLVAAYVRPFVAERIPHSDPRELLTIRDAAGLDAERLARAWSSPESLAGSVLRSGGPEALATGALATLSRDRGLASLESVRADADGLRRLVDGRNAAAGFTSGPDRGGGR
jgi:hypothetical protein